VNPPFISDMGQSFTLTSDTGEQRKLPRYGVWMYVQSRRKYQVEETSDDLAALQQKYGPDLKVYDQGPKP